MKRSPIHLSNLIVLWGMAIAAFFVVPAFASSPFDIEFPIPELNNCPDKISCKTYCDDPAHLEACHAFAAKHGLGATRQEIDERFRKLEEDGGPGGCARDAANPTLACKRYCDQSANMRECVAYAKRNDLMGDRELQEAEKVIAALDRGVALPAQCRDAISCKELCERPDNIETARACFAFAEAAGLLPEGVTHDQAELMFRALEEGNTPFASFAEMRQCENPDTDELLEKCIQFGTEHGLIPPEDAEIVKKTGGKGPGGCRGRQQCEEYCETNPEECFAFAEEHGILREEDRQHMEEGVTQFREMIEDLPEEVTTCVRGALPDLDQILSGKKLPSQKMGQQIQKCFQEAFSSQGFPGGPGEGFGPPGEFGEHGEGEFGPPGEFPGHPGEFPGAPGAFPAGPPGGGGIPPEVKACLEQKFGEGFLEGGQGPPQDLQVKISECVRESFGAQAPEGTRGVSPSQEGGQLPPFPAFPGGEHPPEGTPESSAQYPAGSLPPPGEGDTPYQQQYREEYQRQYEQQYQQQFQQQYPSSPPSSPSSPPPTTEGHSGFRTFFRNVRDLLGNMFSALER